MGVTLQSAVVARGVAFNQPRRQEYTAFGFPFNKQRGKTLWSCTGHFVRTDPHPLPHGALPFGIGCDMGAGASGGGWVIPSEPEELGGLLASLSSFGYAHQRVLYGPYFDNSTRRIYNTAAALPTPAP